MVVCKFYAEGYCKYGSRCRFEHSNYYEYDNNSTRTTNVSYTSPLTGTYSNSGTSVLRSDLKINKNVDPRTNTNEDMQPQVINSSLNDVIQIASRDTQQFEKGNQWPLTSYAPVKEYGNLPGWDDHSPEELRWASYNALKNGTFLTCKQTIDNLYKIAQERRNDMKIKEKITSIIDNLIRNGPERPPETGNLQWAGQNHSSAFSNITSSTNKNTSFGTSESAFTSNQHNSGSAGSFFGPALQAFRSSSTFSTTTSVFGPSSSAIGSATTAFGSAPPPFESAPPAFGSAALPFGSGSSVSGETGSVFGSQPNTVPQSEFVFSLNTQTKPTANVSTQNSFQTPQYKQKYSKDKDESFIYSATNILTPDELRAFESQTFTFGSIPLKPPPKNLCGI